MPVKYAVGDRFPDCRLVDDREREVRISELAEGQPLILAFYRGPW